MTNLPAIEKGLREALTAASEAHPGQRIELWFQDEARVGQKGRLCHRWWTCGRRSPLRCGQRFEWTYIFGAVAPATGKAFALVLPFADKEMMNLYLAEFTKTIPEGVHVVMVLDGAGWHGKAALKVPDNVTLAGGVREGLRQAQQDRWWSSSASTACQNPGTRLTRSGRRLPAARHHRSAARHP